MNLLVRLPNWLGDTVMAVPTLQSLSAATLQLETLSRLRVEVTVSDRQAFPRTLGDEVYRLVRKRSATSPDTRMLVSPASR